MVDGEESKVETSKSRPTPSGSVAEAEVRIFSCAKLLTFCDFPWYLHIQTPGSRSSPSPSRQKKKKRRTTASPDEDDDEMDLKYGAEHVIRLVVNVIY